MPLLPVTRRITRRRWWRRLKRHPLARMLVVGALAALSVTTAMSAIGKAEDARREWGETRAVAVATRALEAGAAVAADDVEVRWWPVGLAPADAVAEPPVGRIVSAPIVEGEPIVAARLAPAGLSGLAALVPAGWRALAIPVTAATPPLQVGDHVDLLATFEQATEGPPTFLVATEAQVLVVGEQAVTIAVPAADVARVAFAVSTGTVIPALRGAR